MSYDRVLIDTHTLIWIAEGRGFLGYGLTSEATRAIVDAEAIMMSHASLCEIANKSALPGKRTLRLSAPCSEWIDMVIERGGFVVLPLHESHLKRVATLPPHHGDPFDRLLVAQSLVEGVPIVSADPALDAYGVERVW